MEHTEITRRRFLRMVAVTSGGVTLAACAPKNEGVEKEAATAIEKKETAVVEPIATPQPAPVGRVSIRFTTDWYGGVRGELTNQFLAKWKDEVHPDIAVAYEPCPRVQDRLRVDFAAGTPPDVMLFAPELFASFGEQLLVLDEFWAAADQAWKDDTLGWDPTFYFNGRLVAVPFQHNIWQPMINLDLFEQAGVKMPWEYDHNGDKWWDWNDFLETAIAIGGLGDDVYGCEILVGGSSYMSWGPWIRSNGGEYVRPPWPAYGEKVKSALNEPQAVEALTFYTDLVCKHKVAIPPDVARSMTETLQVSPFFAGKVGIAQVTSEGGIRRAKMNAHRVVAPRSPRTRYARYHQGNCPHVAWNKTQYPEACWQLMKFLDSPWAQKEIGLKGGGMPGLKSVLADPDYYQDFPAIAREALLVGAKENECLPGAFLNFEEWRKDVEAIAMDMLLCKIPVEQGIQEMHDTAERILAT
ncbi:MAG: ABC transporter substrate-binding protein [Anaerolineae bacterium]